MSFLNLLQVSRRYNMALQNTIRDLYLPAGKIQAFYFFESRLKNLRVAEKIDNFSHLVWTF